jgi:hypothetical protein
MRLSLLLPSVPPEVYPANAPCPLCSLCILCILRLLGSGFCTAGDAGASTWTPYQSAVLTKSRSPLAGLAALRACGSVADQAK